MSNLQQYVIDTNTIIDLNYGGLLHLIFRLPCEFVVTDLLCEELLHPPFDYLSRLGLVAEPLDPEQMEELGSLILTYNATSTVDLSVLVIARKKNTILITGDEALRHAAISNGVTCYGTCWLIDYLTKEQFIRYTEAIDSYNLIRDNKRNPPKDECISLSKKWKERKKMLE